MTALFMGPEISIIVPCYNERNNIRPLVAAVSDAMAGERWEIVFVDDNSPDGTTDEIRGLARRDSRVRGICRVGRRGLSSAVIEGALSSAADIIVVMDADLQHDESILKPMIGALREGQCDIAIGSRHVEGGDNAGLSSDWRRRLSGLGIRIARFFLPVFVNDPMSGFFAMKAQDFTRLVPALSGTGFKILVDLLLSSPPSVRIKEVPFQFRPRLHGQSKLDILTLVQFAGMLVDKLCGGVLPGRFMSFACIGAIGILVNLLVLNLARSLHAGFETAQICGTVAAMVGNFFMNNELTYRDYRLAGAALYRGLAVFMLVCACGAVANIGIARVVFAAHEGWNLAAAAGALVGVVWNYAVSSTLIWRTR